MKSYSVTDVGQKRRVNQDYVYANPGPIGIGNLPNLFLVADGMGGHNAGDFASRCAVDTIVEHVQQNKEKNPIKILRAAIEAANRKIVEEAVAHEEMTGMGTTIVATTVVDNYAYVANVGDSRMYVIDDDITQITNDHSLVEEMVRLGELTPEEARNHPDKHIITRALGAAADVRIDFFDCKIKPGGRILMCSDGLSNMVDDKSIRRIVKKYDKLENSAQTLVKQANENGGKDNIAVVIIEPDTDEVEVC